MELTGEQSCNADGVPMIQEDQSFVRISRGTIDQANQRFAHGGLQCSCIVLEALRQTLHKPPSCWESTDIDEIVVQGDALFSEYLPEGDERMLMVNELPRLFERNGVTYELEILDDSFATGFIDESCNVSDVQVSLAVALANGFDIASMLILVFDSYTICMVKSDEKYYVFDSHSRNAEGCSSVDGTAVLLEFQIVHQVHEYLQTLFESLNLKRNAIFELTPVKLEIVQNVYEFTNTEGEVQTIEDNLELNKVSISTKHTVNERKRYATDPIFAERKRSKFRDKYDKDEIYRHKRRAEKRMRYQSDIAYSRKVREVSRQRYWTDHVYNMKMRARNNLNKKSHAEKYKNNEWYRRQLSEAVRKRYKNNEWYRRQLNEAARKRYKTDETYRRQLTERGKRRYREDSVYARELNMRNRRHYQENAEYAARMIQRNKTKYKTNKEYATAVNFRAKQSKKQNKFKGGNKLNQPRSTTQKIKKCIAKFKACCKEGPNYICSVCHRQLFKVGVRYCNKTVYCKNRSNAKLCITSKYVHRCDDNCQETCKFKSTSYGSEWICHTCHRHLMAGQMPPQAAANKMDLFPIPPELKQLNILEKQLIALTLPFMKIVSLPKGGQRGIHGPTICVPSDIGKIQSICPRNLDDAKLVKIKLKRKLEYKGHYSFQAISVEKVKDALVRLKEDNNFYKRRCN